MKCRKCGNELTDDDIVAVVAAHDDRLIDVIVKCSECEHCINNFVDMSDAIDL